MASVYHKKPASPRQAVALRAKVDRLLDPGRFKALADPNRARILACLVKCGRPCSVTEVAQCCSVDFSMVARHLAMLARAGVLDARKEGRTVWYSANRRELAAWFRDIADAIEEWGTTTYCELGDCGGEGG